MDYLGSYVLKHVTLFYGNELDLVTNAEIVVEDGKISSISGTKSDGSILKDFNKEEVKVHPTNRSKIAWIDLDGYVLIPSFINSAVVVNHLNCRTRELLANLGTQNDDTYAVADVISNYLEDKITSSRYSGIVETSIFVDFDKPRMLTELRAKLRNLNDTMLIARDCDSFPSQSYALIAPKFMESKFPFEHSGFHMCQTFLNREIGIGVRPVVVTGDAFISPYNLWVLIKSVYRRHSHEKCLSEDALINILKSVTVHPSKLYGVTNNGTIKSGSKACFQVFRLPSGGGHQVSDILDEILSGRSFDLNNYAVIENGYLLKALGLLGHIMSPLLPNSLPLNPTDVLPSRKDSNPVADAIAAFQRGEFVMVVDELNRENEGDLLCPAQDMTCEKLSFMLRNTSGIVCVSMDHELLNKLDLKPMVSSNTDRFETAFTISCDYMEGTTSGVSLKDRTITIKKLADPNSRPQDFSRPGHVFPLMPRKRGILERMGHTESGWELCRLAKKTRAAALAELVDPWGNTSDARACVEFARLWNIVMITTRDLREYVITNE